MHEALHNACAGASETVATVGLWEQKPNIYNAVPRSVRLDIDIRDSDGDRRDGVIKTAIDGAAEIAAARKCGHSAEIMFEYPVAQSDKKVGAPHPPMPLVPIMLWPRAAPACTGAGCFLLMLVKSQISPRRWEFVP
jgi:hypothetical protein